MNVDVGGPAAQALIPLPIEAGAAAVIAVTTHGPFGDPERATGRWLPWLRLAAAVTFLGAPGLRPPPHPRLKTGANRS